MAITWNPEALKKVQDLKTNCIDFIYLACEHVASMRESSAVTTENVDVVLGFIAANSISFCSCDRSSGRIDHACDYCKSQGRKGAMD